LWKRRAKARRLHAADFYDFARKESDRECQSLWA
jgi:hypothetical protein